MRGVSVMDVERGVVERVLPTYQKEDDRKIQLQGRKKKKQKLSHPPTFKSSISTSCQGKKKKISGQRGVVSCISSSTFSPPLLVVGSFCGMLSLLDLRMRSPALQAIYSPYSSSSNCNVGRSGVSCVRWWRDSGVIFGGRGIETSSSDIAMLDLRSIQSSSSSSNSNKSDNKFIQTWSRPSYSNQKLEFDVSGSSLFFGDGDGKLVEVDVRGEAAINHQQDENKEEEEDGPISTNIHVFLVIYLLIYI